MTKEDKELLLRDLCCRLPYGVKGRVYAETAIIGEYDIESGHQLYEDTAFIAELNTINLAGDIIHVTAVGNEDTVSFINEQQDWGEPYTIEGFEPYLRPMSSMTEEEAKEMFGVLYPYKNVTVEIEQDKVRYGYIENDSFCHEVFHFNDIYSLEQLDWLNQHHFDYRGLISKGLALEAPSDMYK